MNLPKELEFERLTVDEKYRRAVPGYMKRLCGLYEAIYERSGGDCPGFVFPRVKLLSEHTKNPDHPIETLHFGTCMNLAMETADYPIDFDDPKIIPEKKSSIKVELAIHSYQHVSPKSERLNENLY